MYSKRKQTKRVLVNIYLHAEQNKITTSFFPGLPCSKKLSYCHGGISISSQGRKSVSKKVPSTANSAL